MRGRCLRSRAHQWIACIPTPWRKQGLHTYASAIEKLNMLQSNHAAVAALRNSGNALNKNAIPEMLEYARRIGYEADDFNRLNAVHIAGTKGKGSTAAMTASILAQFKTPSISSDDETPSSSPYSHGSKNKIGLYTSPHLRHVRERIQINGQPLSEEAFTHHFHTLWDRLGSFSPSHSPPNSSTTTTPSSQFSNLPLRPSYFRFLTLLAYHVFLTARVAAAVIECGIGGEYDSTNLLRQPAVTGITSLGYDHTELLGNTIGEIAWHKGGVMKRGVECFTVSGQGEEAMGVLRGRARERGAMGLYVVGREEEERLRGVEIGLEGGFQRGNAALAVQLAGAWVRKHGGGNRGGVAGGDGTLAPEVVAGLEKVRFPGRCDVRVDKKLVGRVKWYIDAAHTVESLRLATEWFATHLARDGTTSHSTTTSSSTYPSFPSNTSKPAAPHPRILLFNQQTRSPLPLLQAIHTTLSSHTSESADRAPSFTHAIFTSNQTRRSTGFSPELQNAMVDPHAVEKGEVQRAMVGLWRGIEGERAGKGAEVHVCGSIEEAVGLVREIASAAAQDGERGQGQRGGREGEQGGVEVKEGDGGEVKVFATGSVHLVGGLLEILETED